MVVVFYLSRFQCWLQDATKGAMIQENAILKFVAFLMCVMEAICTVRNDQSEDKVAKIKEFASFSLFQNTYLDVEVVISCFSSKAPITCQAWSYLLYLYR